jgi:hypothetical protein
MVFESCYASVMNEEVPRITVVTNERMDTRNEELKALAKELYESHEIFPFPGLDAESYAKLKASDEEFPGYTTPIDELIERFKKEGIKVALGKNPDGGNIFILPAQSDGIERDSVFPKHFQTNTELNEKLRRLIEQSK